MKESIKNMRETLKRLDELENFLKEKNNDKFKKNKSKVKDSIMKLIDESEEAIFCVTDKGVAVSGSGYDVILSIGMGLKSMAEGNNMPKKAIFEMLNDIFDESDEEDSAEDIFEEFKKKIEEM